MVNVCLHLAVLLCVFILMFQEDTLQRWYLVMFKDAVHSDKLPKCVKWKNNIFSKQQIKKTYSCQLVLKNNFFSSLIPP